jgi:hypothetical protein
MILAQATPSNSTDRQRASASWLRQHYSIQGCKPRSSTLQLDETTGYITLVFDQLLRGVSYDPWVTIQVDVDADGAWRSYDRRSGWSDWQDRPTP